MPTWMRITPNMQTPLTAGIEYTKNCRDSTVCTAGFPQFGAISGCGHFTSFAGRLTRNVVPLPASLSTWMLPPCASTIIRD